MSELIQRSKSWSNALYLLGLTSMESSVSKANRKTLLRLSWNILLSPSHRLWLLRLETIEYSRVLYHFWKLSGNISSRFWSLSRRDDGTVRAPWLKSNAEKGQNLPKPFKIAKPSFSLLYPNITREFLEVVFPIGPVNPKNTICTISIRCHLIWYDLSFIHIPSFWHTM